MASASAPAPAAETPLRDLIRDIQGLASETLHFSAPTLSPRPGMSHYDAFDGKQECSAFVDDANFAVEDARDNIIRFVEGIFDCVGKWLTSTEKHTAIDADTELRMDKIFEACVAFILQGKASGGRGDGGVDVLLQDGGIVQCKRGPSFANKMNETVRALAGAALLAGASHAALALSVDYKPTDQLSSTLETFKSKNILIQIHDKSALLSLLGKEKKTELEFLTQKIAPDPEYYEYDEEPPSPSDLFSTEQLATECKRVVQRLHYALGKQVVDVSHFDQLAATIRSIEDAADDAVARAQEFQQHYDDDDSAKPWEKELIHRDGF